ncbi:hypothetical protein [Streptomyces sp. NPDC005209]|uniref:hypothetical protein n=1 Tax=Streptomyces sp. NPDC005209 TaxID=3156715 RepID=UPI0033B547D7
MTKPELAPVDETVHTQAKGPRSYDRALAEVTWPGGAENGPSHGYVHLLLVRRSITDPPQITYFAVHAKAGTPIGELVRVMGLRRSIEDCFETAAVRLRPGPLRGPHLGRLAPPHHPVHGRPRLPDPHRHPHPQPRRWL